MKIIVTGGAGFIGSHLVDRLIELGHKVIILDNLSTGREEFLNPKANFYKVDLSQDWAIGMVTTREEVFSNIDYIFHLAALPRIQLSLDHPTKTFRSNVLATQNVLEIARLLKVKRLIYASSSSVYGLSTSFPLYEKLPCRPNSLYASHKHMSEMLCEQYTKHFGLDCVALRYFNVYGKRASTVGAYKLVIAKFLEQKAKGEPMTVYGSGKQTRDFTYIDDVIEASLRCMLVPKNNIFLKFNVCSGKETTVNKIAKLIGGETKYIENPRPYEEKRKVGSYDLLNYWVGYTPRVSIEEGIKKCGS